MYVPIIESSNRKWVRSLLRTRDRVLGSTKGETGGISHYSKLALTTYLN
jgi:hypothetical protein